jgi:hypothetical protein
MGHQRLSLWVCHKAASSLRADISTLGEHGSFVPISVIQTAKTAS